MLAIENGNAKKARAHVSLGGIKEIKMLFKLTNNKSKSKDNNAARMPTIILFRLYDLSLELSK